MGKYKVKCKICGKLLGSISWVHLRIHNITFKKYKNMFPNTKFHSKTFIKKCRKNGKINIKTLQLKMKSDKKLLNRIRKIQQKTKNYSSLFPTGSPVFT